jgi:hypothetical protein
VRQAGRAALGAKRSRVQEICAGNSRKKRRRRRRKRSGSLRIFSMSNRSVAVSRLRKLQLLNGAGSAQRALINTASARRRQQARLLPVPCYLLTVTVSAKLRAAFLCYPQKSYPFSSPPWPNQLSRFAPGASTMAGPRCGAILTI